MKKQILGNTGLELSNICYGTGNFGTALSQEEAFETLDSFLEHGGNFIDTANVYCKWVQGLGNSSEQYIGKWLKTRNAYDKVTIATKGGHYNFARPEVSRINRKAIAEDLEESLAALGVDQIDLYWLHRDDKEVGIEVIVDMMEEFVKAGKIRYYGASNYTVERVERARIYARQHNLQGFSAVSNQWSMAAVNEGCNINSDKSLVLMDRRYYHWHQKHQVPMVPYSAGAYGYFDKLHRGQALSEEMEKAYKNHKNEVIYQGLSLLSEESGLPVHTLSMAWLLNQPFPVFPVVSVSKAEQMKDIVAASEVVLDNEFIKRYIP